MRDSDLPTFFYERITDYLQTHPYVCVRARARCGCFLSYSACLNTFWSRGVGGCVRCTDTSLNSLDNQLSGFACDKCCRLVPIATGVCTRCAAPGERPCAHQYVSKSQSCMLQNGSGGGWRRWWRATCLTRNSGCTAPRRRNCAESPAVPSFWLASFFFVIFVVFFSIKCKWTDIYLRF